MLIFSCWQAIYLFRFGRQVLTHILWSVLSSLGLYHVGLPHKSITWVSLRSRFRPTHEFHPQKSLKCELGSDPCICKPGWVQKILINFIGSLSQTNSSLWSPHYFSITGASCFWPCSQKPTTSAIVPYPGTEKEGRKVKGFGSHLDTTASGNRGCFPSLRSLPPGDPLASPVSVATTVGLLGSLGARQRRKERNGRFSTHLLSSRSSLFLLLRWNERVSPRALGLYQSKFPAAKDEAEEIPERVNP